MPDMGIPICILMQYYHDEGFAIDAAPHMLVMRHAAADYPHRVYKFPVEWRFTGIFRRRFDAV